MSITIGITSFNRGKYLNVLLQSLSNECVTKSHQVIIVDNSSTEQRIYDTLLNHDKPTWINEIVLRKKETNNWINDEYIAKNIIIEKSIHDVILFLQDDLQFVGHHDSLDIYSQALLESPFLCLTANGVRRKTLIEKHTEGFVKYNNVKLWKYNDNHFHTMGFFKKETFEKIGAYPTNWPLSSEYWGRSEDWYNHVVNKQFANLPISATAHVPLFLPVWNDPRGGYAFLRNGKRYGYYLDPVVGHKLYYDQFNVQQWESYQETKDPMSFIDVAKPCGWVLPVDISGDPMKFPQTKVLQEGPISEIDA